MPWLMKAEPDSRVVKGKDVKFSVDDLEKIGTSPWDGVRNHEAKKIMKDKMKLGDKVLFYHSNCKTPGVFALAEIAKEGYPDYTAWDPDHPYFDPKSSKDTPTWYMVNVRFLRRLSHPPTLSLIKALAATPQAHLPEEIAYIDKEGLKAIGDMQLVNRGRLSVQPVQQEAYDAVVLLGTKGGWDVLDPALKKGVKAKDKVVKDKAEDKVVKGKIARGKRDAAVTADAADAEPVATEGQRESKKARVVEAADQEVAPRRRSMRGKT